MVQSTYFGNVYHKKHIGCT